MKKLILAVSICLLTSYFLHAQQVSASTTEVHPVSGEPLKYCGTTEALHNLYKNNPGLEAQVDQMEVETRKASETNPASKSGLPIYTIPDRKSVV